MEILYWAKIQTVCFLVLVYIGIIYLLEGNDLRRITKNNLNCNPFFDALFILSEVTVLLDGITICTVNYPDFIPWNINLFLHLIMLISYELYLMMLFSYWLKMTAGDSKSTKGKVLLSLPGIILILLTVINIPKLEIIEGKYTNYSSGVPVSLCIICVVIYSVFIAIVIITRRRYIEEKKAKSLLMVMACVCTLLSIEVVYPESLVSSLAITMITISIYFNLENPAVHGLEHYQHEMVMGFAMLVENKDDSTGGHIRRTSAYAVLIAQNLRKSRKYEKVITKDFMDDMEQSAPMHDIGKIGIPDSILQKPGKLTEEEFAKMKEHPVIGGRIVQETFGHLYNEKYGKMAYQVALYHHEKWNGKGYPNGISGTDIPLAARIMAVADVFDAVSAKRCYRDAMPLEKCYRIIEEGRGKDFDPDIVDAFLMDRERIEDIYYSKLHL